MLTVYSTQGSPGASTTAIYMATFWAAEGREVLFVEADPSGGLLSLNLGIQFTPGSASFMASGLPTLGKHLVDHSQDVLFNNLHVMPAPPSPTGARDIAEMFSNRAEELRAISQQDMAVIVDGGRITADAMVSGLTSQASAVVIVARDDAQLTGLEHLKGTLGGTHAQGGFKACAVTIGKSPLNKDEWQSKCGLLLSGSIAMVPDMTGDLAVFLARNKRKFKKWRISLQRVGDALYPYAHPPEHAQPEPSPPQPQPEPSPPQPELSPPQPQPEPELYTPQPQPELSPPQPQPDIYTPQPPPELYAPQPQPELSPPQPQPELYAPQPQPELSPPQPQPELSPPQPQPELSPPQPQPDIYTPQPQPDIYTPQPQPETLTPLQPQLSPPQPELSPPQPHTINSPTPQDTPAQHHPTNPLHPAQRYPDDQLKTEPHTLPTTGSFRDWAARMHNVHHSDSPESDPDTPR